MTLEPPALEPEQRALYLRQIMLPQIGEAGQRRICSAASPVAASKDMNERLVRTAHEVATRYALRAGFQRTAPGGIVMEEEAPSEWLAQPVARAFLAGARSALRAVRQAAASAQQREPAPMVTGSADESQPRGS